MQCIYNVKLGKGCETHWQIPQRARPSPKRQEFKHLEYPVKAHVNTSVMK